MKKRLRKKQLKKSQANIKEAMASRIKTLEQENNELKAAVGEVNLAANALMVSAVIFCGQPIDSDGSIYTLAIPRPNINCRYKLSVNAMDDSPFYNLIAEEIADE